MLIITVVSLLVATIISLDTLLTQGADTTFAATVQVKSKQSVVSVLEVERELDKYKERLDKSQLIYDDIKRSLDRMSVKICEEQELQNVKEIANKTPLDYKTAIIVDYYADKFDLDISLVLGVIDLESQFNQYEVGSAQDRGYMQIIPSTEKWLFNEYGELLKFNYDPQRIFEPEYNIGLGCLYLYQLKTRHGSNIHRILSEYNRGPYNLKKYYDKHGTYVTKYSKTAKERASKYKEFNKS